MFWRRNGSVFDVNDHSLMAWLLRIIALVIIAAVVALMIRLMSPKATAAEDPLPHAVDAGWKGEKVCEPLFENEQLRAARCAFPPGVGHERHYHNAHWGYIVEGGVMQITDKDGTREQPTPAGASWWSDGVEWHEALNIGDSTTVYIIIEPKNAVKD